MEGLVQQNLTLKDTPKLAVQTNVPNVEIILKQNILFNNTSRAAIQTESKRVLANQN